MLLDGAPLLNFAGAKLVRLAYPYAFVPMPTENLVYCDGMDRAIAKNLLAGRDEDSRTMQRSTRSWACRVSFRTSWPGQARRGRPFERDNNMAERAARLNREGMLFASWLFATDGLAATAFEDRVAFAETMQEFGMAAPDIVAGI